eukprot:87320_1
MLFVQENKNAGNKSIQRSFKLSINNIKTHQTAIKIIICNINTKQDIYKTQNMIYCSVIVRNTISPSITANDKHQTFRQFPSVEKLSSDISMSIFTPHVVAGVSNKNIETEENYYYMLPPMQTKSSLRNGLNFVTRDKTVSNTEINLILRDALVNNDERTLKPMKS